eukprot:scaffold1042_cov401-Prasinococcus_capsulatus_cf.AAC.33
MMRGGAPAGTGREERASGAAAPPPARPRRRGPAGGRPELDRDAGLHDPWHVTLLTWSPAKPGMSPYPEEQAPLFAPGSAGD